MCSGASCLHFVDRASCSEGSELQEGPDSGQSDPSVDDLSSCCSLLKGRERQCHGELTPGWLWRSPMLWSLQEKGCRCPAGRSHRAGRTCSPGGPEPSLAGPQAPRGPAPLLLAPGFPHLLDPSSAPFSPGASRRPWSQHLLLAPILLSLFLVSGPSSIAKVACLLAGPQTPPPTRTPLEFHTCMRDITRSVVHRAGNLTLTARSHLSPKPAPPQGHLLCSLGCAPLLPASYRP